MLLSAIILAGGEDNDRLPNKPLIKINGKPMIKYVIDALKETGRVDKILVVGKKNLLKPHIKNDVYKIIESTESLIDNVMIGINELRNERRVLILTCDIPLITSEAILDFIEKAEETECDFCYPIVKKELNDQKYPEAKRTYARLKEGIFTGGNIVYINPRIMEKCMDKAKEMVMYRKKPLKLCSILGWRFVLQLLLGVLTIPKLERRVSEMFDIKVKAIISDYPEIGNDVDKPDDVVMVRNYLSG